MAPWPLSAGYTSRAEQRHGPVHACMAGMHDGRGTPSHRAASAAATAQRQQRSGNSGSSFTARRGGAMRRGQVAAGVNPRGWNSAAVVQKAWR